MKNPILQNTSARVSRGGFWYDEDWYALRSESRDYSLPAGRAYGIGLRIVRTKEKS